MSASPTLLGSMSAPFPPGYVSSASVHITSISADTPLTRSHIRPHQAGRQVLATPRDTTAQGQASARSAEGLDHPGTSAPPA
ncbi:hypothetical protein OH77DRAFT_1431627 [Trametes cingulata]|nr:hypothetical protein OH77DRAFT_1431627 [Trametes cingulata]